MRQRKYDIQFLWPECCAHAENEFGARVAFAYHCVSDKSWVVLGHEGVHKIMKDLPYTGKGTKLDEMVYDAGKY